MDSKIKQSAKGRVLTLIGKINELRLLGYEDSDLNHLLPPAMEGWESELMEAYSCLYE